MSSFSPRAGECLLGAGWDFTTSSLLLLLLPWLVAVAAAAAARTRWAPGGLAAGCRLLDLLYLPVTARIVLLLNEDRSIPQTGVSAVHAITLGRAVRV